MLRNNRKILDLIPNISYPYRLIFSYFSIYWGKEEYKKIKYAVLKINDWDNEYLNYYTLYNVILSLDNYDLNKADRYNHYYECIFGVPLSEKTNNYLCECMNKRKNHFLIADMLYEIKSFNAQEGFLVFLFVSKVINYFYNNLIILPYNLFESMNKINNKYIFAFYLNALLLDKKSHNQKDLFNLIREYYSTKKLELTTNSKLKNIYLFGSIKDDEYHRESDIDMVLEFENDCKQDEITKVKKHIAHINEIVFKRKSDLHEYSDFLWRNPNISLVSLF